MRTCGQILSLFIPLGFCLFAGCPKVGSPPIVQETVVVPAQAIPQSPPTPAQPPAKPTTPPYSNGRPPLETPPAAVTEVLNQYLHALDAGDIEAMAAVAAVPFVARDRQLVRDRTRLPMVLQQMAAQSPPNAVKRSIYSTSYASLRESIKDDVTRQLLAEVMDDDDWVISLGEDPFTVRTILVRFDQGRAAVIAGPLKPSQIGTPKRIPEPVLTLLSQAERFELFSLNPEGLAAVSPTDLSNGFHGWPVLGQVIVQDEVERQRLVGVFRQATEDNHGAFALCFKPRHGLRLIRGDQTVDLVICFECSSVKVLINDQRAPGFLTTFLPQQEFDATLTAAGIALPKPQER